MIISSLITYDLSNMALNNHMQTPNATNDTIICMMKRVVFIPILL